MILTTQDAPEFNGVPQVVLRTAKLPVVSMELIFTLAPVLVSLTAFEVLVVPSACGLKETLDGDGEMIGLLATAKGRAANAAQGAPLGKFSIHT